MEFSIAADEISRVESKAKEYKPHTSEKYEAKRVLELSPPDISEMEYGDILNQYHRLEKIISTSSLEAGILGEEAPELPPAPKPAMRAVEEVEHEMQKIKDESAKEVEEISTLPVLEKPELEKGKKEEAPSETVSPEQEAPFALEDEILEPTEPAPIETQEEIPVVPQEEAPAPEIQKSPPEEAAPAPPKEAPSLQVTTPAMPTGSPLKQADETMHRLETQLRAQMTGKKTKKVDVDDTKKRMLELTRELFRERSTDRRSEIKKEIVTLKSLLSKTRGKTTVGGLPKGSLFTALKSEQEFELKQAKERIHAIYEQKQKEITSDFEAQRAVEDREAAFETFSKHMAELEHHIIETTEKYQTFLTAKHAAELSKLKAKGQSSTESEKLRGTLKQQYAHEFSSLKESMGEEVHSQIDTTRAVLFESAGDPEARVLSKAANSPEEDLFTLLQAKDSRTYDKYARGEITRSEALATARRMMAKEAGVDEDTINKRFGVK